MSATIASNPFADPFGRLPAKLADIPSPLPSHAAEGGTLMRLPQPVPGLLRLATRIAQVLAVIAVAKRARWRTAWLTPPSRRMRLARLLARPTIGVDPHSGDDLIPGHAEVVAPTLQRHRTPAADLLRHHVLW